MEIRFIFLTMSVINNWNTLKEDMAAFPPVGCLNQ